MTFCFSIKLRRRIYSLKRWATLSPIWVGYKDARIDPPRISRIVFMDPSLEIAGLNMVVALQSGLIWVIWRPFLEDPGRILGGSRGSWYQKSVSKLDRDCEESQRILQPNCVLECPNFLNGISKNLWGSPERIPPESSPAPNKKKKIFLNKKKEKEMEWNRRRK